jgi:tetratricopeptide (TPR) repeat protein
MRNIFLSLLLGVIVFALLFATGVLRLGESILPAVFATVIAYFLLARWVFKKVEKIFTDASKSLQSMPPKFDLAIAGMEKAYAYAPMQLGVRSQVDAQIGVIYFLQKEFNKAQPFLARALGFGHWMAAAMLAVIQYKKKDHDEMRKTLEIVTKRAKKQALAWCLRAYLLAQVGDRDAAQQALVEGVKKTKDDAKVKEALLAVQNNRKIKMRAFKEQWFQFHLERPPAQYQQVVVGGRMPKAARRGRW